MSCGAISSTRTLAKSYCLLPCSEGLNASLSLRGKRRVPRVRHIKIQHYVWLIFRQIIGYFVYNNLAVFSCYLGRGENLQDYVVLFFENGDVKFWKWREFPASQKLELVSNCKIEVLIFRKIFVPNNYVIFLKKWKVTGGKWIRKRISNQGRKPVKPVKLRLRYLPIYNKLKQNYQHWTY